jgi:hypothetical protein
MYINERSFNFCRNTKYSLKLGSAELATTIKSNATSNSVTFGSFTYTPNGTYNVSIVNNLGIQIDNGDLQITCFCKGTKITCIDGDKLIEDIKINEQVLTYKHGYKKVIYIQNYKFKNDTSINQIYKYNDLYLTGGHSFLVDELTENEKIKTLEIWNELKMIDDKYLLLACVNEKCHKIDDQNEYELFHLVLENDNEYSHYGIYSNGILTESLSIHCFINSGGLIIL